MGEQINIVMFSEKRNSTNVKVSHKTMNKDVLSRRVLAHAGGKNEIHKAAKDIEQKASLIVLHYDYITVSIIKILDTGISESRYINLDLYYIILDAVNELYESDIILSKSDWEEELEAIDKIKTIKLENDCIGIFDCNKRAEEFGKKEILQGIGVSYESIANKIKWLHKAIPTTLLIMLADIKEIKKIIFWDEFNIIGVIYKGGTKYAFELNKKSYSYIKDTIKS